MRTGRIALRGGAGLLGKNVVAESQEEGYPHIVVTDKHRASPAIFESVQPGVIAKYDGLLERGDRDMHFVGIRSKIPDCQTGRCNLLDLRCL